MSDGVYQADSIESREGYLGILECLRSGNLSMHDHPMGGLVCAVQEEVPTFVRATFGRTLPYWGMA